MADISLAVITGEHTFEVPPFHTLFQSLPGVKAYPQPLEDWGADVGGWRKHYDCVLFYNMHRNLPSADGTGLEKKTLTALEELRNTSQGIIILHHALLAFPAWNYWTELTGIPDRTLKRYDHDQWMKIQVIDPLHPVTQGLSSFEILDETYQMESAGVDNTILLTTDHPKSMKTIAWVRSVNQAKVFCLALGHDHQSWENPNFQKILLQGITWTKS